MKGKLLYNYYYLDFSRYTVPNCKFRLKVRKALSCIVPLSNAALYFSSERSLLGVNQHLLEFCKLETISPLKWALKM